MSELQATTLSGSGRALIQSDRRTFTSLMRLAEIPYFQEKNVSRKLFPYFDMTKEERAAYMRRWSKSPAGIMHYNRKQEQQRKAREALKCFSYLTKRGKKRKITRDFAIEDSRRGRYLSCDREKQVRYDPLVNWGASRGIHRSAGSSFMLCHQ